MNKWLLVAGVVLAIITGLLLNNYVSELEASQSSESYLRLSPDTVLGKGMPLEQAMLESVSLPQSFSDLYSFAIPDTPDARQWIIGRTVSRDVPAGSLLQYDFFSDSPEERFAATIEPDMRAMSIPVNPVTSVTYFIEPGSRIDIVGTLLQPMEMPEIPAEYRNQAGIPADFAFDGVTSLVTKTILQNVKVLAVGNATTRSGYLASVPGEYSTITIEVTPEQGEVLVFAMNELQDNLTIMLRNPANQDVAQLPAVNWENLNKSNQ